MAHALETNPINQLEENLQCSVCRETLKDPRTLPCCHSFCRDCLEGVVKTCRDKAPRDQPAIREFHCPNCRTKFTLDPDKHVADMPRNHFICNMVQATAVLDGGTLVPCSHNCSQGFSVARCVTCEKFLCRECLKDHNKYRANNGHSVLSMEELSKPENRKKIQGKMYCNEHSGEILKVYCETCDQLICRDCMDFKHLKQNHPCLLVKDVANNYKELIASNNNAMENALTEGNVFLEGLSLSTRAVDQNAENAKRKILQNRDAVLKNVSEVLDKKAETLLKEEVEQIHKKQRAMLDRQTEETTRYLENIKQSVQLSKKLVEQGTEEEIISSQKMMLGNADNLLKKRSEFLNKAIDVKFSNSSCGNENQFNEEILRSLGNSLRWVKCEKGETGNEHEQGSKQLDVTFNVNSLFLRYIMAYHDEDFQKLENVCKEITVVVKSKSDKDLKIIPHDYVDEKEFSKAVDDFIDFYQATQQKMHQEVLPVSSQIDKSVISEARLKFPVVIDLSDGPEKITIYGERDSVQDALTFLKGKVGGFPTGSSASKAKVATGEKVRIEKLSCVLHKNVKVSVYQGDITKETSDVIVNPANEDLKHDCGVAAAIVKAGGKSIQAESDDIMKRRRYYSLNAGDVVQTAAGNLPCKIIVHAAGPRWYNYHYTQKITAKNALFAAIVNSLTIASQNGATSISIPAISSGIFGVPVEICAEILFAAVSNFAKNAPEPNSVKDIRFVNIDTQTSQVFVQEMQKRFHGSIQLELVEVFHSSNAGRNDRSNRDGQRQLNPWEQTQITPSKSSGAVDPKTNVAYGGSHDSRPADNKKGNQGNKSTLNPSAPTFSTSGNPSSPKPGSYSNAVTGDAAKEKEKNLKHDPKSTGDEKCSICLCGFTDKKTLAKCGHSFCSVCIDEAFKHQKKCPNCSKVYGPLIGNQPQGQMFVNRSSISLPGYESCGTISINYKFESGLQGPNHPNPGKSYHGTMRNGYLPDNKEGQKVLKLLRKAFDQKLTFTIGRSSTSGANNVITWNDIHHKTNLRGGQTNFGYPDPDYLKKVQDELAAKGITE